MNFFLQVLFFHFINEHFFIYLFLSSFFIASHEKNQLFENSIYCNQWCTFFVPSFTRSFWLHSLFPNFYNEFACKFTPRFTAYVHTLNRWLLLLSCWSSMYHKHDISRFYFLQLDPPVHILKGRSCTHLLLVTCQTLLRLFM